MFFKKTAVAVLSWVFLSWAGAAWAYTINDNTLVGQGNSNFPDGTHDDVFVWMDQVGGSNHLNSGTYNVFGIDTVFSGGNLTISLYTNFTGTEEVYINKEKTNFFLNTLADLALDLNLDGRYEYGVALTGREDGIVMGTLYSDVAWLTSKDYFEGKTYYDYHYGEVWGDEDHNSFHSGQSPIVHIGSGTEVIGQGITWTGDPTVLGVDPSYRYDLIIPLTLFGDDLGDQIGIFWAGYTCANDIIEGIAPVPLPPSILLLASGLVGLLVISRRGRTAA